jgi:hypothetical protein
MSLFTYGLQYEVVFDKDLDLYDDVLPICIYLRKNVQIKYNYPNTLILFSYEELGERFRQNRHNKQQYVYLKNTSRKTHPDIYKFIDVKNYNNYIKYEKNIILPISQEELNNYDQKYNQLKNNFNNLTVDDIKELEKLEEILKIQHIVSNPEYYDEIKELENEVTKIEFTNEEKEIITKMLNYPKLKDNILFVKMNLVKDFW